VAQLFRTHPQIPPDLEMKKDLPVSLLVVSWFGISLFLGPLVFAHVSRHWLLSSSPSSSLLLLLLSLML
jgi:hypothetical protein